MPPFYSVTLVSPRYSWCPPPVSLYSSSGTTVRMILLPLLLVTPVLSSSPPPAPILFIINSQVHYSIVHPYRTSVLYSIGVHLYCTVQYRCIDSIISSQPGVFHSELAAKTRSSLTEQWKVFVPPSLMSQPRVLLTHDMDPEVIYLCL